MATTMGRDPVRAEATELLERMKRGELIDGSYERKAVDLKEEAGRREPGGRILQGGPRNEAAAKKLAGEAACMANTPGGGALIVGVANDGTLLGTDLEGEWLRQRIYELTQRLLTVDVWEETVRNVRLLVLISPDAVEPIRVDGKIRWRVADSCVEVDAASWHARRMARLNYDWSNDSSGVPPTKARQGALQIARDFLQRAGDPGADDLVRASDFQLLRRLNVITHDGMLTNAGFLAFVGRGEPAVDYIRRDYAGGDSITRSRVRGRSLLEELEAVFTFIDAHTVTRHSGAGLVGRQIRDIPTLAAREAIVNGVAHREWAISAPTVVEHVGRTLRVTSPGGFFGGVNESNIITHPSQSRNAALTQLLADLRVAEREGIGVDRMVREMIRVGHQPPVIKELDGPHVRAALVGDALDEPWMAWLGLIAPAEETADVSSLLILRDLVLDGWVDELRAARLIQLPVEEARGAIRKLGRAEIAGQSLLSSVDGVPDGAPPGWSLSAAAIRQLEQLDALSGARRAWPTRAQVASSYARARGRISSTELGSLVGAAPSNVGAVLKGLAAEGDLVPSNTAGRGQGFHYKWAGDVAS